MPSSVATGGPAGAGRRISVSRQVIESLARELRMTPAEREHLFTVAGLAVPAQTAGPPEVDDTLRRLVQTLDPNPAFVVNPWWDLLAYNQTYSALHGGLDARPPAELNVLWLFFAIDPARHLMVNWLDEARQLVGQLRAHLAQYPGDPRGPNSSPPSPQPAPSSPNCGRSTERHDSTATARDTSTRPRDSSASTT